MEFIGSTFALSVASFLLGMFLCAVYDLFRVFRRRRKTNVVLLFLSDMLYSTIVSISVLLLYFNFTYGRVRVFAIAILALGFLSWRFTISRIAMNLCDRIINFVYKLLNSSKMRVIRFIKRMSRRIYTDFYCRTTVRHFRKGCKK